MLSMATPAGADNFGKIYYDAKTDQLVVTMLYRGTKRFSLANLPRARPASVTLRTAPRFFYTLTIPS
jgi:hypothetical protein